VTKTVTDAGAPVPLQRRTAAPEGGVVPGLAEAESADGGEGCENGAEIGGRTEHRAVSEQRVEPFRTFVEAEAEAEVAAEAGGQALDPLACVDHLAEQGDHAAESGRASART